jgi:hypothetical protein
MTLNLPIRLLSLTLGLGAMALPAQAQFGGLVGNILGAASSLTGSSPNAATPTAAGAASGAPAVVAVDMAQIDAVLKAPPELLDGVNAVKGTLDQLRGKRFYISEYRVLFEQSGSIAANTRAAYLGGTNYGATRMTVRYAARPTTLPCCRW